MVGLVIGGLDWAALYFYYYGLVDMDPACSIFVNQGIKVVISEIPRTQNCQSSKI